MSNVNHPNHYQSESGLEVIDVIKAFTSELSGEEAFCIGNAIKYICRYSKKNGVEDLEKSKWYIDRVISVRNERLKNTQKMECDYNIGRFVFSSRDDALDVLKKLQSIVHERGYVTLADLHDMCEFAFPSPFNKKIGWKSVDDFHIVPRARGDWELVPNERPISIED